MSEISRRNALSAAVWSAPVIAVAVAAPAIAATDANPTVTITNIAYQGFDDFYYIHMRFAGIPASPDTYGHLSWTPSSPGFVVDGHESFIAPKPPIPLVSLELYGFTPGVTYTFTVTLTGGATGTATYTHTF